MNAPAARLLSLDVFRGFTIAAMLLVNNPGTWQHIHPPLKHADWDGCTFTDLIFPFFLFISGVAMALSLGRRAEAGDDKAVLLRQTARRALTIIAIGLFLNLVFLFEWERLRLPGVLQRIGLCTLLAAPLVLYLGRIGQWVAMGLLLAVYTAVQTLVPVPDAQGVWRTAAWQPGQDVGAFIDRWVFGTQHLWRKAKTWDPEGLLSTLPAVVVLLGGVRMGHWLQRPLSAARRMLTLGVGGALLIAAGLVLGEVSMPVNKSLWTPAYSLLTTGWALWVFAAFYALLDAAPPSLAATTKRLAWPLQVFGMNALFLFALSGVIAKAMGYFKLTGPEGQPISLQAWLYAPLRHSGLQPENASLVFALGFVGVMFLVAWFMWHKRWFVKV